MMACISLDLEPDYAGRVPTAHTGWDEGRVEGLLRLLGDRGVPLTVFVVADSLEAQPRVIERFAHHGAEFHLHSFSHDLRHPDSPDEIRRGAEAFQAFFGRRPEGYRAPEGRISAAGWRCLEEEGFLFDSSVFPSFWPRPRYVLFPREPYRPTGGELLEIPVATVAPHRLIVSLSWMKLLGWPAYRALLEMGSLPEPVVFDMHLHDLWQAPSYRQLKAPWRWIYSRGRDGGLMILERFLDLLVRRGYRFSTLGSVVREIRAEGRC